MADDTGKMPSPPLGPAPPRPGRGLRVALFVSVALNLLIVGALIGAAIGERRDHGAAHRVADRALIPLGLGLYARAMDPADRRALLAQARARRDALRAPRAAFLAGMSDLAVALRAEPFDPARARAILDRQGGAAMQQLRTGRDLLIDRLSAMTPEARAAFARRLEERMPREGPPR